MTVQPHVILGSLLCGSPFEQIKTDTGLTADQILQTVQGGLRALLVDWIFEGNGAQLDIAQADVESLERLLFIDEYDDSRAAEYRSAARVLLNNLYALSRRG